MQRHRVRIAKNHRQPIWTGQLAMTFATSNEIRVTELGVFDDNAVEEFSRVQTSISVLLMPAGDNHTCGPDKHFLEQLPEYSTADIEWYN
ncbi:MAG: hypothetical protein IPK25_00005 [Saprospiraceae bacterium]|nr:hypothetical protein [Saprospiraceae bacterium]